MIYGTIAGWRAYALARGNSAPTDTPDADANAALQRASDYIRTRYVLRLGLAADDANVIEATYIAAGYDLPNPGFWQTTYTPAQAKVLTGVSSVSWTLHPNADMRKGHAAQVPVSPAIEALLPGSDSSGAFLGVFG